MTYEAWETRHRVTTVQPGKLDLFAVTLVDGVCTALRPITEYEEALERAPALVRNRHQVKVLPMTGPELRNLFGIVPDRAPRPSDAYDRSLIVETCRQVLRDSNDGDARRDAYDLLAEMGHIA